MPPIHRSLRFSHGVELGVGLFGKYIKNTPATTKQRPHAQIHAVLRLRRLTASPFAGNGDSYGFSLALSRSLDMGAL